MKAGTHMLLSYTLAYRVLYIAVFFNKLSTFVKIIQWEVYSNTTG